VAWQISLMLMEFQNASPRKCLRIHVLRSVWQMECGTGTRKNFHGACMVYLMRRFPTLLSVPIRHPPGNLGQIHKNKGLILGVAENRILRKPDASKARREV